MRLKLFLLTLIVGFSATLHAQTEKFGPDFIGEASLVETIPSLSSRQGAFVRPVFEQKEILDGRSSRVKNIVGKGSVGDYLADNPNYLKNKIAGKAPSLVFDAVSSGSQPSDPSLAVGPDHVVVVFNTGVIIYDKEGNDLTGELSDSMFFADPDTCCDLTVSYDNAANRWVLTILSAIPAGNARALIQIAVSDGPDPITSNWFSYEIAESSDYQKLAVWSDGYYMTNNGTTRAFAMDRTAMLAGDPTASIQGFAIPGLSTMGFASPQFLNVSDDNLPAAGNAPLVFFQDDAYSGVTEDHVKFWSVNADFDNPANSTISSPQEIIVTPFTSIFDGTSFSNLSQPNGGQDLDALQGIIMNQAQFRKFSSYNSAIFNHVVDVDETGGELAAVRWYEFRQTADGEPWTLYQEGTYTAPDGKHAWNASLIMDVFGNIGMGYTGMDGDNDVEVSSYYTGRFVNDPLGTMTIAEELIAAGDGPINSFRYGDYSKIDLDPNNDKTFWFINEYNGPNTPSGQRSDVVGRFQIAPDFNNDTGVVSIDSPADGVLSASENVAVTIFNFGENQQVAIPLELIVDGTTVATEVFAGPLESATSAQYTFTTPVDLGTEGQTYTVTAQTNLATDEDNTNDATTRDITYIFANDIGVTEITSPDSGEGLGVETVTVTIENFGAADQSNFDVNYTVNDGTAVTESVAGPLTAGTTTSYTFTTPADLSTPDQAYTIVASTSLTGDINTGNNATTKTVVNLTCNSTTNDTVMSIGPDGGTVTESVISITEDFIVTQAQVGLNLEHTFTGDLDIFLIAPDGTQVELSTDNGGSGENMIGTVFSDNAATSIESGSAPFTGMFQPEGMLSDFDGLSSLGDWTLQITDDAGGDGGQLLDWTLILCDNLGLGFDDNLLAEAELIILDKGNDQFKIQLATTEITDRLELRVTNMLGQTLLGYRLDNDGSGYNYDLDMSYAASGVYIVTLGSTNGKAGKSKRLIVR